MLPTLVATSRSIRVVNDTRANAPSQAGPHRDPIRVPVVPPDKFIFLRQGVCDRGRRNIFGLVDEDRSWWHDSFGATRSPRMVALDDRHDVPALWAPTSGDWHSGEDESPFIGPEVDEPKHKAVASRRTLSEATAS